MKFKPCMIKISSHLFFNSNEWVSIKIFFTIGIVFLIAPFKISNSALKYSNISLEEDEYDSEQAYNSMRISNPTEFCESMRFFKWVLNELNEF